MAAQLLAFPPDHVIYAAKLIIAAVIIAAVLLLAEYNFEQKKRKRGPWGPT